ncbi:hypothetical protein GFS24_17340 [Chitinophaga sp. SYP-B3965]|uniref:hypothetical protein n=1 Tax=Chitinophaga sp. SYP-B3965 TaxID=2663120 RepID=UPI001299AE0D|nr:hypothetical protein [Chitinophaga sp. SYP-B3965]MRG46889.1 hypothetical protein [Chitinophaga sp. SYP-B3965]
MPKRKKLNGLPHNLTRSLFGTERYYVCGYMGDWLFNMARQLNISEVTIDILSANIDPAQLNIPPLIMHIKDLQPIIQKELNAHGFPADFIVEAKIRIQFLDPTIYRKTFHCFPTLTDKDGRKYAPGRIVESAYEEMFDPFDKISFWDKFKSTFN